MLSVCIPVYNFDISNLIESLSNQINKLNVECEIIIIDDCSEHHFNEINKLASKNCKYIELTKNVGRAAIRNQFLKYAKFQYFLFLDCDSLIISDNFLQKYISEIEKQKTEVICGGRIYENKKPNKNQLLSWKYGILKESKPIENRSLNVYASFMTNNFVVDRNIFEQIKFDERLTEYGHEDTLFGFQLQQRKVNVLQIDNPVLNGDIEKNNIYLMKTEIGIINLIQILKFVSYEKQFINYVKILSFHKKLKDKHLDKLILVLFLISKPFLKLLLKKGIVNLYLFDFYKLGFLIQNSKK